MGTRLTTTSPDSRLQWAAEISIYLVLAYLINVAFIFPVADAYLKPLMLISVLLCLGLRRQAGDWSTVQSAGLLKPLAFYTAVLLGSYLAYDGFESTIWMFFFCSVFVYSASFIRLSSRLLTLAVVFAALECLVLILLHGSEAGDERLQGATNPIFFGMYTLVMALLAAYLSVGETPAWRIGLRLTALVFLCAAALTLSRGVLLALIPLVPLYLWHLSATRRHGRRNLLLAFIGGAVLGGAVISQTALPSRVEQALSEYSAATQAGEGHFESSVGFRLLIWQFALDVAAEHPLFGAGNEQFQAYKQVWVDQGRYDPALVEFLPGAHSHNQYLQDLALRGVLGLAALLYLMAGPGIRAIEMIRARQSHLASAGYLLLSLSLAYAVFSLTEVAFKHPEKIALFALVAFIALRLDKATEARPGGEQ
jgi:O-antigen ligase